MRRVETGVADNTYIEIKSGVKVGEEVVSGSYAAISRTLKDGSKILVEKPKKDEQELSVRAARTSPPSAPP